jgi:hypothetical protein
MDVADPPAVRAARQSASCARTARRSRRSPCARRYHRCGEAGTLQYLEVARDTGIVEPVDDLAADMLGVGLSLSLSSPTLVAEEVLRQPMAHVIVMKFPNLQPQAARSKCAWPQARTSERDVTFRCRCWTCGSRLPRPSEAAVCAAASVRVRGGVPSPSWQATAPQRRAAMTLPRAGE